MSELCQSNVRVMKGDGDTRGEEESRDRACYVSSLEKQHHHQQQQQQQQQTTLALALLTHTCTRTRTQETDAIKQKQKNILIHERGLTSSGGGALDGACGGKFNGSVAPRFGGGILGGGILGGGILGGMPKFVGGGSAGG